MYKLVGNKWDEILDEEYHKDYFRVLVDFINQEYQTKTVYPLK